MQQLDLVEIYAVHLREQTTDSEFPLTFDFIPNVVKKRVIWQPATNSFWQLVTNRKIMSISATIEKNVATDTLSKYLNTRPYSQHR